MCRYGGNGKQISEAIREATGVSDGGKDFTPSSICGHTSEHTSTFTSTFCRLSRYDVNPDYI